MGYQMIRKMWKIGDKHGKHESRTWRLGRVARPRQATFQSATKTGVTLIDVAGRERTIKFVALSKIDRDYVKRWKDE